VKWSDFGNLGLGCLGRGVHCRRNQWSNAFDRPALAGGTPSGRYQFALFQNGGKDQTLIDGPATGLHQTLHGFAMLPQADGR
jgi:hypothetical protein